MSTASPFPRQRALRRIALAVALAAMSGGCGGGSGSTGNLGRDDAEPAPPPANELPTARVTASDTDGVAPLTVTFDGSDSSDPDGRIARFHWEFGDGETLTTSDPTATHTYTDTGTLVAALEVVDDDGGRDRVTTSVLVRGSTLSGVIRIAPASSVDSDVNDSLTSPVGNDGFDTAQSVRNPVRLGGYAGQPGSGPASGNFHDTGDVDDFFLVELTGDERVVLSIGDPSADLDLRLYGDDRTLLDASVSADATEDLDVPGPGRYFVHVLAESGASNYVLDISEDPPQVGLGRQAKRLSDPFVAGEVLMAATSADRIRRFGIEPSPRGRHFHFTRRDANAGAPPDMRLPEVTLPPGARVAPLRLRRYRTLLAAKHARAQGMDLAEVNVLRQPLREPGDELYPLQWHFTNIDLELAWEITTGEDTGRPDVVVAVVDSGVLLDHPDIREQLLRDDTGAVVGFDFIQDPDRANDGDGLDPDPSDPGDDARGEGRGSFHGTHVAGTIAADSDNGIGVAGVSWGAKLMALRVLGVNGGTTFDVMQAVRYAAGLDNVSGIRPPVQADVVNMSLGSDFYSEAEQRAMNEARAQGVFLVASAGNGGSTIPSYPGAYAGVVSVGATTLTRARAPYSNLGPQVDLVAPGGDTSRRFSVAGESHPAGVLSTLGQGSGTDIENGYGFLQGTSMAAPHVAGVIALMKSIYPQLTPAQFDALLAAGDITDDRGVPGRDDTFGWGEINAFKAVRAAFDAQAGGSAGLGPLLSVSADRLNFGAFTDALDFSVRNVGDSEVAVTVSADVPWLRVFQPSPTDDGLGNYRIVVDRGQLAEGTHGATIVVEPDRSDLPPRSVEVVVRVVSVDLAANAGQHYVVLVNPADGETVTSTVVAAVDGEYSFDLTDVPPGRYHLYAGTDLDDDGFICDGGEACGAYPSLSNPTAVDVTAEDDGALRELVFVSEFRTTAVPTATAAGSPDRLPRRAP